MRLHDWLQIILFFGVLLVLLVPLGSYMARVYESEQILLSRVFGPFERLLYRLAGVQSQPGQRNSWEEMDWKRYAKALLMFQCLGWLFLYGLQRLQGFLPWNPQSFKGVEPLLAVNTAISFVTNTNWQAYGGETTMSHVVQMMGLTVQNFLSAGTGMAVAVALIRGISRRSSQTIGNFWVDLIRSVLYILLPLSILVAIILVSQGVVQTMSGATTVSVLQQPFQDSSVQQQTLSLGPVASQVAIKQLGTNGGGFFNANGAHPFENPTPLSNFIQMICILIIPASFCYTFGKMVKDKRQGWALLTAMGLVFVGVLALGIYAETQGNPKFASLPLDTHSSLLQAGGNMEGKEIRFGNINSALWATATTAASNGSVNAMHDSFMPLGGLGPLWLMQLGEVIFGGVGSGLYGMLVFALFAVFIAGLMVGRTPEYLGKKVEIFEIKMGALVILLPAASVLIGTAIAVMTQAGTSSMGNPGAHGFTEVLYAFSSTANNNGSAFGGLTANTTFYNIATGICMLIGRYWVMIPVLALAGSLAKKGTVPSGAGTLPTHTPLFIGLLIGVVLLMGALTFLPALALGPIVEHLMLLGRS